MTKFLKKLKSVHWHHYIAYVAIAVFILITLIAKPSLSNRFLFEKVAIAIILATSLNLVVGILGELSLGHAGFMCVGAFLGGKVAALLVEALGNGFLTLLVSVLAGGACAAIAGVVIGLPALRLRGDYLAIVTLAFGEIVRVIFQNSSRQSFGGAFGLETPRYPNKTLFILAFLFAMVSIAVVSNLIRSKHGRAITAIRDSEIAARATGVNVTRYKLMAFTVSAFFAGVAGVLYSFTQSTVQSSHFDYNYSIEILVMVVFGGLGSLNGSVISATVITVLNEKLSSMFSKLGLSDIAVLRQIIYAVILILIVIYTNAPALSTFREKYNLTKLREKIFKHKKDPSVIKNDAGAWDRIPTKIAMNEVLSVDLKVNESVTDPDKEEHR